MSDAASPEPRRQSARAKRAEEQTRRLEAGIRQERRRRYLRWGAVVGVAVIALALLVPQIVSRVSRSTLDERRFPVGTAQHVDGPVTYSTIPPVGGDHAAAWLNCGYYPQSPPSENAVHSMEHGAVWITHQPDLPTDQVGRLRDLARQTYVIVSPYAALPAPVVASAWGVQMQFPDAADPQLAEFVRRYRQGPQTPEPGAACTGGVGQPVR